MRATQNDIRSIRRRMLPVFRRYHVRKAAVFGSYARGEARKTSDLDLLVDMKPIGLFGLVDFRDALSKRLGRSVDVVSYKALNPRIRDRVLREQVLIYEKKS